MMKQMTDYQSQSANISHMPTVSRAMLAIGAEPVASTPAATGSKKRGRCGAAHNLRNRTYRRLSIAAPAQSVSSLCMASTKDKTAEPSQRRCAQYIGALKSFESPHYAPGYFSRNL